MMWWWSSPNGRNGTPTRRSISSITREGDFVEGDDGINPRATTIKNNATKGPREFATTIKGNYTIEWIEVFTTTSKRELVPSWLKKRWCCNNEQNKRIRRGEQDSCWWWIELCGGPTQGDNF